MATNIARGDGKLYDVYNDRFISIVNYKIYEEQSMGDTIGKWSGELTLADSINIPDGRRYVIELEDGRKGRCTLRRRINRAVSMVPLRYFYLILGVGELG